ncbi:SET domain-containing protein-lysine N-methyltransferase [Streptomyces sp. NPDC008265]|uniref:SET domain-containing protein n=1 Tax=Streptomyces sp. NPDC008265 TaxID=3364824 RepID=UPI0036ED3922
MLTSGIDIRPSTTDNVGLFATEPIPAGTVVWLPCVKCPTWTAAELGAVPAERFGLLDKYGHLLDDGSLLLPCMGAFLMNHSCAANVLDTGLDFGVAVRDIAPGEEVTCDYSTFTADVGWSMECNCRAPQCRGTITTQEGEDPALRARLTERLDLVLPRVAAVDQPLHDVVSAVSPAYALLRQGAASVAAAGSAATVCAPSFMPR